MRLSLDIRLSKKAVKCLLQNISMCIAEYINIRNLALILRKRKVKQTQMKGKHLIKYQMFMKGRRHLRDIPEI